MTMSKLAPLVLTSLAALSVGCSDVDSFVPVDSLGGPRGALEGAIVYEGPRPCTRDGSVVGAALVLAFERGALPPPDGLGTEPAGLTVVPGATLFAGVAVEHAADGAALCPGASEPNVSASATFAVAPLEAGVYELRAFYDRDGDFNPAFSIFNLPTRGDVAGGALENLSESLAGARPRFQGIELGTADATGRRVLPPTGQRVSGIAIALGRVLPLERPMFHVGAALAAGGAALPSVALTSDEQLGDFNVTDPASAEAALPRARLRAGLPSEELAAGKARPFYLPVADPSFAVTRFDRNGDGMRDEGDHIPETKLVPSLAPLALFTKLDLATGGRQVAPLVVLEGLTILDDLVTTALSKPELLVARDELVVGLRPSVVCVDPRDGARPATLLVSRETDAKGRPVVSDPTAVTSALSKRLGRPVELLYGCLPEGHYAMNLVYETGQAWTVPNEAGVCAPSEPMSPDGSRCGSRARLASQSAVLTVAGPRDAGYCAAHPTPSACLP